MRWIKLYGQTTDSDFWLIDQPFSYRDAFIHVLISANWKPGITNKNGHTLQVQRGQWLTSVRKLADVFHWKDHKKVYKWLKFMESAGMITSKSVGFGTLLTVVNYDKYQCDGYEDTHTPTNENTHTPPHKDTPRYKNIDKRQQNEDIKSAPAEPPPVEQIGPPIGSPEWYELHKDD